MLIHFFDSVAVILHTGSFIYYVCTQNFPKNFTPWYAHVLEPIRGEGVRNISVSENFAYVLNEWPLES